LPKLVTNLSDKQDKELSVLASKILINLTTNDKIRKSVSEMGAVDVSLSMLSSTDDELRLQGAKLVTNLAISGSNRKTMHDKGLVADLRKLSKIILEHPTLKTQIDIALDNCSFPYEHKYEDLNFGIEEKMPQLPPDEEEEDEDERRERLEHEEEERKLKLQQEEEELEQQRKALEKEKEEISLREAEEERKRQEELQREKELEEERRRKQAAEEDERKRKEEEEKLQLEEQQRKEEEEKRKRDTLIRRRTATERLKLLEEKVKDQESAFAKRQVEDREAREKREKKEKEERAKRAFDATHKAEKRTKVINDILQTEKNYVLLLSLLIKKFLNPLQASAKSQRPILTIEKIKSIFSVVEVIYNYHQLLFESLESRIKRWLADHMLTPLVIGDIFVRMTDYMSCYSSYINNYNNSLGTITEQKKSNSAFVQFLKGVESDPDVRNQELESFVITPVQQLPRYVMLLSDLLKNTAEDHADYPTLLTAVEKLRKLTTFVNEQKREVEDASAIVNIQQNIRGKFPSLLVPYRRFLKEGYLNFGENGSIRSKEGYAFLFNDILVFTLKSTSKTEYTYKDDLKLDPTAFKLENLKDDAKYKNGFLLKGPRNFTLVARTPVDKIGWMDAIKAALSNLNAKK